MKMKIFALLLALTLLIPAALAETAEKPVLLGDFETTDIYDAEYDATLVSDAKLCFVNVWGTYCSPCIEEIPYLAELAEEYDGRVQFIGIVGDVNYGQGIDEQLKQLAVEIVEQTNADNYPHLIPSDEMNSRVLFSITAYPTSFFLDADGKQVGYAKIGSKSKEEWRQIIDEALALVEDQTA